MKEEQSEAILFADWLLENAVQSYDGEDMCWEYEDVLYTTKQMYIEFINFNFSK